jgi:hypothetical protein
MLGLAPARRGAVRRIDPSEITFLDGATDNYGAEQARRDVDDDDDRPRRRRRRRRPVLGAGLLGSDGSTDATASDEAPEEDHSLDEHARLLAKRDRFLNNAAAKRLLPQE